MTKPQSPPRPSPRVAGSSRAVETLWAKLLRNGLGSRPETLRIAFVSPLPRQGTTTVAASAAVSFARSVNSRVLLLELTRRRRPGLARMFGLRRSPGFWEVLGDQEAFAHSVQPTAVPGLSVLPAGRPPRDAIANSLVVRAPQLLDEIEARSGAVLLDLPALFPPSDALVLLRGVTGAVLVLRSRKVTRGVAESAKRVLGDLDVPIFGVVLNRYRPVGPSWLMRDPWLPKT